MNGILCKLLEFEKQYRILCNNNDNNHNNHNNNNHNNNNNNNNNNYLYLPSKTENRLHQENELLRVVLEN